MRIVLTLIATAACAGAPSLHAQEHAPPPASAPVQAGAQHLPVSAMGRAMAALLDQAIRTQAPPTHADVAPARATAAANRPVAAEPNAPVPVGASQEQVAVH